MEKELEERWNRAVALKNDTKFPIEKSDWNRRCEESLKKARLEAEQRYGIKIGKTEIYCARCGKPWGFGGHVCQDVRLKELHEKKRKSPELEKVENEVWVILKKLGPRKVSIYLMTPEWTVKKWIQRKSIPSKFGDKILNLKKYV